MAKSKVVIIGGFGVVGSSLIGQLSLQENSNELEIHVVTRTAGRPVPALGNSNTVLHVHQLDIFNTDQVSSFLKEIRARYLVHLAWVTTHGKYWDDPSNHSWVQASSHLFREFYWLGGERVLGVGTSAEYCWFSTEPLSEKASLCKPASLYGKCKLKLFDDLQDIANQAGSSSFAWARLFNIYGGEDIKTSKKLFSKVARSLLQKQALTFDHCSQLRDFLHVDEVASALVKVLFSDHHGAINIGSRNPITIRDFIVLIAGALNADHLVQFSEPFDPRCQDTVVPDTSLLCHAVNWHPARSNIENISQVCASLATDKKAF